MATSRPVRRLGTAGGVLARPLAAAAALWAIAALAGVAAVRAGAVEVDVHDPHIYFDYGETFARGVLPYRDRALEYPPGVVPLFVLPALVTDAYGTFELVFVAAMLAVAAATALAVVQLGRLTLPDPRERLLRLAAVAVAGAALSGVAVTRFDLVPAGLTAAAVLAFARDRHRLGAVVLGIAAAVKLYPLVVAPVAIAYAYRRRGAREGAAVLGLAAGVVAAAYAPWAAVAPDGVADSLRFQLLRPLQVESLAGAAVGAAHAAGADALVGGAPFYDLHGPAAELAKDVTAVVAASALLVVWWSALRRGTPTPAHLVTHAAAAVAAFVAFGKVLSPQYLVWLLPLVPLVPGRSGRGATAALVAACGLTALYFPRWWLRITADLELGVVAIVLLRDLALIGVLAALVAAGRRGNAGHVVP